MEGDLSEGKQNVGYFQSHCMNVFLTVSFTYDRKTNY